MKNLSKHAEWLSLIEISGPFLTVSMLDKAFPQGLEAVETPRRQKLRAAYEEWREAVDQEDRLLPELHREWVRLVLTEMLEYDQESLVHTGDWPDEIPSVSSQEHAGTFKPDWIVRSPADGKPRLFITVLPPDTDLESVQRGDGWPVSLQERMTLLCRAHGVRVGLLTDGERWMLVNAPVGSTSSQASWYARLWFQEPITLKAFQSLLGVRRCFGPAEDTLESLLDESLKHHEEVTDTLGEQVRRAVEVLVQCLDKADEDRNRELLRDVKPAELYEAGLTVMMRLVFVLCAEERGLLLLGDSVYDRCYAVSTLRGQLAEEAERHGPEVLDRRHDAWARLLAVFRAVYGGVEHESLRMPALGGSLFDPDRFPFLEGRAKGTRWRDTSAAPLPIDNRTVLLLLNSLQILEQSGGALLLSYRALDVEQIGHVYEGLLEHTVARVPRVTLGLQGSQKAKNPNVALAELESARLDGEAALVKLVLEVTGRSESAIKNGLSKSADDKIFGRVLGICGGDTALTESIRPFTNLLRTDAWDDPIVYRDKSFIVTLGADRRETGTHYTPKFLTESIVTTTLEPVLYFGPAEGKPREEWTLKSSREILDLKVCDPAMGSGAFLVQACRYLGEKLVEAWLHEEATGKAITVDGEALDRLGAAEPLPSQLDERLTIARRLVAERCLYGVDVNPLAVELAKLSIWLVTLAKGRPFGFLDHNLRSGDSLLGIHQLEQLTQLRMDVESGQQYQLRIFGQNIGAAVNDAIELRKRLRATTIRDIKDVENMARLDREARRKLESIELIADAMIGEVIRCGGNSRALDNALDTLAAMAGDFLIDNVKLGEQIVRQASKNLAIDLPVDKRPRKPFHWAIEFPEVFESGGFTAVTNNPPFLATSGGVGNNSVSMKAFFQSFYSEVTTGAYDQANLFILLATRILKNKGTYGIIMPQSNLSPGGSDGLQIHINKAAPPQRFWIFENPKLFGGANVFICAISGVKGTSPVLSMASIMPRDSLEFIVYAGTPSYLDSNKTIPWWSWVSSVRSGEEAKEKKVQGNTDIFVNLKDIVDIFAGCATDVAYELSNIVSESQIGEGLKLVTTGSIDRYMNFWGVQVQRYLKSKYLYPRWPSASHIEPAVFRAAKRQTRKKIVIGGLTKTIEAYYDEVGDLGGVVSTWVLLPKEKRDVSRLTDESRILGALEILLNSYCVSWIYSTNFGAQKSPWGGMTIKKDGLASIPIPKDMFDKKRDNTSDGWIHDDPWSIDVTNRIARENAICFLWETAGLIANARDKNDLFSVLEIDRSCQKTICWLYGYSEQQYKQISSWFLELEKTDRQAIEDLIKSRSETKNIENIFIHGNIISTSVTTTKIQDYVEIVRAFLQEEEGWLSKADIVERCNIPINQWQSTINQLLTDGLIERHGERRGAKYRAVIRNR